MAFAVGIMSLFVERLCVMARHARPSRPLRAVRLLGRHRVVASVAALVVVSVAVVAPWLVLSRIHAAALQDCRTAVRLLSDAQGDLDRVLSQARSASQDVGDDEVSDPKTLAAVRADVRAGASDTADPSCAPHEGRAELSRRAQEARRGLTVVQRRVDGVAAHVDALQDSHDAHAKSVLSDKRDAALALVERTQGAPVDATAVEALRQAVSEADAALRDGGSHAARYDEAAARLDERMKAVADALDGHASPASETEPPSGAANGTDGTSRGSGGTTPPPPTEVYESVPVQCDATFADGVLVSTTCDQSTDEGRAQLEEAWRQYERKRQESAEQPGASCSAGQDPSEGDPERCP